MARTKIETADSVWNPVRGCSKWSTGCRECFACRTAGRFNGPGLPYEGLTRRTAHGWEWTGEVRCIDEKLDDPSHVATPQLFFVNSMADLFHRQVPDVFIADVFNTMLASDWHTYFTLTKRVLRMEQWFGSEAAAGIEHLAYDLGVQWPLKHVRIGASVENQAAADDRVAALQRCPGSTRILSCEPLLGEIDLGDLEGIHQVIAGCETGPKSRIRPMKEDWVRHLRDQCIERGVAFFYKQNLNESGVRVRMPLLDGRQWGEQPA